MYLNNIGPLEGININPLIWLLIALLINSLLGFIGIITFWIKEKTLNRLLTFFVAFSAGTLLGGAFFHLLPEGLGKLPSMHAFTYAIIGFISFLIIEGYFHWHQCEKCNIHPFSYTMLIGDGVHNFIDGLIIGTSFFTNINLGIITTLIIILHEAPQELGLFGSLRYAGYNKNKSLNYSFLAQSTCIIGGILGYFLSTYVSIISPFLISFAAGGFIYIAASDLVPEIHKAYKGDIKKSIISVLFLVFGILFTVFVKFIGG